MWARVVSFLFCILVFQCSGGIYLSSVSEMMGATTLMQEDILMAGYASFIGITMIFPVLFRLKFRLPTRTILPIVAVGLIVGNIITMSTDNLMVLAITCFFTGVLRMWGTFECFSSIQLRITPRVTLPYSSRLSTSRYLAAYNSRGWSPPTSPTFTAGTTCTTWP